MENNINTSTHTIIVMVKICSSVYPVSKEEKYKSHFEKYPYPLSSFQKYSIEAIVEGQHVLVCVPTGSGKTLSGEFAIEYFVGLGKKVIYTSPIKALSNQKFHDFTNKFPHISTLKFNSRIIKKEYEDLE
jgi:superfamily II RNA helicase